MGERECNNFTVIQMVERGPKTGGHDLEEPFDEDFWLKVEQGYSAISLQNMLI